MIAVRLGRSVDLCDVVLRLDEPAAHLVIAGRTRSGKTQAAQNILAQLAENPSVRVVGIDPTGLLLTPFHDAGEAAVSLDSTDPSHGLEILTEVKRISDERITSLYAKRIDKITEFTSSDPLILVVLEEFPQIVDDASSWDLMSGARASDRCAPRFLSLFSALVSQSAKAGVRVLVLMQRAEASTLSGTARSNIATRMTLATDNTASVEMLHPGVDRETADIARSFPPGMALFESPDFPRTMMRNDYVPTYATYVEHVVKHYVTQQIQSSNRQR